MSATLQLPADSPAGEVVLELRDRINPERPPMLIGAEARDVLHARLGHEFANKATQDVDLAFVIPDWSAYEALTDGLEPISDTGIAFRVAGMHVDLMAFGSIESPQGTVTPPFREADPLDVFGMTQVYATADAVRFGGGPEIRLPTVAGYVALKLKAWIDRSAVYNEKDAPDLGLALYWAAESRSFSDRFWRDVDLVSRWKADAGLGGALLLGSDMRAALGANAADHVSELFVESSRDQLARALHGSASDLLLGDGERRLTLLNAMTAGVRGGT